MLKAKELDINKTKYHIFICVDENKPQCCSLEESEKLRKYLKNRIKEINKNNKNNNITVQRTKTHCLRICEDWPILIVYPDWVWYKKANEENIERIIQEHIIWWNIVNELLIDKIECNKINSKKSI